MTKPESLSAELIELLDALEVEVLHAPVEEIQTALCETGQVGESVIFELRSFLNAVEAADDAHDTDITPGKVADDISIYRRH